ncbi:WecB/TagA/CpsF family glycosyltransferase [Erythrobacter arachoides]|uniref:WecB/TagA/CpsF family glycosyltransferase n=1 Tax=Aurantiacibacter arachoides TaxID=1850444 RepID=A0A844ZYL0_9SPHN|nr:WecB/TagA/CpsF family glycosyltransferase [Aurantiacibacter arachoides]MXO93243.1 WecB/TagA/CpsF family glycosyltransferase [Aurantiacibacter arachoides]GGD50838.1 UDP-N-acetyl-D-mannosaminuronic acid transferase [Aurantiacibacter arachoides]
MPVHTNDDHLTAPRHDDPRFVVLGVPVSAVTMAEAVDRIERWAGDGTGRFVCVRDVASLMAIVDNPAISPLHRDAAMIVPDGMPLVWIGKRQGQLVERVCGPDLFEEMLRRSGRTGLNHYFYGGKPGIATKLASQFKNRFPDARVVGASTPPFRDLSETEREETLSAIAASGADVVWIGMSSPKQDVWMWENVHRLSQTLIGVGAAFDFHTGEVRRAPHWMQKNGLEWLFRLLAEPKRLWRRYLVVAPRFVWRVWRERTASEA